MRFQQGAGCTYCNLTGARRRTGVYEMLEIDRPLADAIRRSALHEFSMAARHKRDFVPLARQAVDLACRGLISPSEAMAISSGLEDRPAGIEDRVLDEPAVAELLESA